MRAASRWTFSACAALAFSTTAVNAQTNPFPLPPKEWGPPVPDARPFTYLLIDRLEYRVRSGTDGWAWEGQAWMGGDLNKFWLKSEGEAEINRGPEAADVQALYARRIAPYWHLQAGVREDARPRPSRTQGVIAVEGLAPYWLNVQASAFLGNGVSGRVEIDYDQLLTQRFILQPRLETNFSGSTDRERGIGSGFTDLELGLRLRYEIRRELAPYIGVSWTRKLGNTADIARQQGRDASETAVIIGVRAWY